jgi:hypothetical protein
MEEYMDISFSPISNDTTEKTTIRMAPKPKYAEIPKP